MKKVIQIIIVLYGGYVFAQEDVSTTNVSFHSASISLISGFGSGEANGGAINADVSISKGKHLFSLQGMTGSEVDLLAPSDEFSQLNAFYGREVSLSKSIKFDWHAGAGYFRYVKNAGNSLSEEFSTLGIPVMSKLRFLIGGKFSVGLQFQVNFNTENILYNGGIVFQFNMKSKHDNTP